MKTIAPITFTRAEYSSFLPILRVLRDDPEFEMKLIVSGTHLSPQFGETVGQIEQDGFAIAARVPMEVDSDTPEHVARAVGRAMEGLAERFALLKPDLILLIGDRLELISAATAALAFRIPVAHVSGGDVTEGAIDNQVRYAITQLSHLHFVGLQEHSERLLRMGEEPWRVHVVGEPALDLLNDMRLMSREELSRSLGIELKPPVLAVTYHPTTLGDATAGEEIGELINALKRVPGTLIITMPNADVEWRVVLDGLHKFETERSSARVYQSLGALRYYSLLSHADLVVGNSSSGIWESPSFKIPVINIGDRQKGRYKPANIIDVPCKADAIFQGIQQALQSEFRGTLVNLENPYGDGNAALRILKVLKQMKLDKSLGLKKFVETIIPQ